MHHHTTETAFKIFDKKHSIHVLSKHMNCHNRHMIAIPSIIISGIKWKKKYIKIDLTSRLETRENIEEVDQNCIIIIIIINHFHFSTSILHGSSSKTKWLINVHNQPDSRDI